MVRAKGFSPREEVEKEGGGAKRQERDCEFKKGFKKHRFLYDGRNATK